MAILSMVVSYLVSYIQVFLQVIIALRVASIEFSFKRVAICVLVNILLYAPLVMFFAQFSVITVFIWMFMLIISYRFVFGQSLYASVIMGLLQVSIIGFLEHGMQLLFVSIGGSLQENAYSMGAILQATFAGVLLIAYIMVKHFKLCIPTFEFDRKGKVVLLIYVCSLMLFALPNLFMMEPNKVTAVDGMTLYNIILCFVFFISSVVYLMHFAKATKTAQDYEVARIYGDAMVQNLLELRGFKHEFSNILSTINGFIDTGSLGEMKQFIGSLNVKFVSISTTDIINSQLKKIPLLYGILVEKVYLAECKGIEFRIMVLADLELKYCDTLEFTQMVGILVDNALEAAAEAEQKKVEMEITQDLGRYKISITNSCKEDVQVDQIFNDGYTQKADHTGFGLTFVKSVLKKYSKRGFSMELRTECADKMFTQTLII